MECGDGERTSYIRICFAALAAESERVYSLRGFDMSRSPARSLWPLFAMAAGALLGCVEEARYDAALADLQRARTIAAARGQENAMLYWRQAALIQEIQLRDAQLQQIATARQFVQKLQELMALNADLAKRLTNAEHALEEVAKSPKNDPVVGQRAKAELEEIRLQREEFDTRVAAYQRLIRNVQALVDSGRIKATLNNGHVQFWLPRPIDQTDPWK
jgi:hypothetical protein